MSPKDRLTTFSEQIGFEVEVEVESGVVQAVPGSLSLCGQGSWHLHYRDVLRPRYR